MYSWVIWIALSLIQPVDNVFSQTHCYLGPMILIIHYLLYENKTVQFIFFSVMFIMSPQKALYNSAKVVLRLGKWHQMSLESWNSHVLEQW